MKVHWQTADNQPEEFFGAGFQILREGRSRIERREIRNGVRVTVGRCLLVERLSLRQTAIRCGVSRDMARRLLVRLAPSEYERRRTEWLAMRMRGRKRELDPLRKDLYNRNRREKYARDADYRDKLLARNRGRTRPMRKVA